VDERNGTEANGEYPLTSLEPSLGSLDLPTRPFREYAQVGEVRMEPLCKKLRSVVWKEPSLAMASDRAVRWAAQDSELGIVQMAYAGV
jgi:hypothetical protein